MGKKVNGYDVNAKKESDAPGWHYEIRKGEALFEQGEPEHRDLSKAMKAGTMRAMELDPAGE